MIDFFIDFSWLDALVLLIIVIFIVRRGKSEGSEEPGHRTGSEYYSTPIDEFDSKSTKEHEL